MEKGERWEPVFPLPIVARALSFFLSPSPQPPYPHKRNLNSFAPGDFAEKRVLKVLELFSAHSRAIKS